jgi:hypothetical protein
MGQLDPSFDDEGQKNQEQNGCQNEKATAKSEAGGGLDPLAEGHATPLNRTQGVSPGT